MRCQYCGCWNDDQNQYRISPQEAMAADSFRLGQLQFQQENLIANQLSQITQPYPQGGYLPTSGSQGPESCGR